MQKYWQYCKDIPARNDNNNAIITFAENNLTDSFNFKVKFTGKTGNNETKVVEIMVPLKIYQPEKVIIMQLLFLQRTILLIHLILK